jgi:hypothetical protein
VSSSSLSALIRFMRRLDRQGLCVPTQSRVWLCGAGLLLPAWPNRVLQVRCTVIRHNLLSSARHKLLGFQAIFLLFTLIWAVARAVFFQLLYGWSSDAYVILYWAPFVLQFATFSFLILFYHATLSHSQLDNYGGLRTGVALYVAVNTLLLVVLVAVIALVITSGELQYALFLVRMLESFVAAMWFLLSLALGVYGWRVSRFLRSPGALVGLANIPSSRVLVVSLLLVIIFLSRVGYDAFSCVRGVAPLAVDGSGAWQMVALGCMFFCW